MAPIFLDCSCGAHFEVDPALAGRSGRCGHCGAPLAVPPPEPPLVLISSPSPESAPVAPAPFLPDPPGAASPSAGRNRAQAVALALGAALLALAAAGTWGAYRHRRLQSVLADRTTEARRLAEQLEQATEGRRALDERIRSLAQAVEKAAADEAAARKEVADLVAALAEKDRVLETAHAERDAARARLQTALADAQTARPPDESDPAAGDAGSIARYKLVALDCNRRLRHAHDELYVLRTGLGALLRMQAEEMQTDPNTTAFKAQIAGLRLQMRQAEFDLQLVTRMKQRCVSRLAELGYDWAGKHDEEEHELAESLERVEERLGGLEVTLPPP